MEKTLEQKRKEFLDETIAFYNLNNRCADDEGCCYYYMDGKEGCAIGRHIPDKELCKRLDEMKDGCCGSSVGTNNNVFDKLPDNLKELGQTFLHAIQALHDSSIYWTDYGISGYGLKLAKEIRDKFNLH